MIFILLFFSLTNTLLADADLEFLESKERLQKLRAENKNLKQEIQTQNTISKMELENQRLVLTKECKENKLDSCVSLAESYFKENSFNKGIDILKDKCELKLGNACLLVANKYLAKKDQSNSIKYLGKACDAADFETCNQLGILQFRSKKVKESLETFAKNCANNFLQSCFNQLLVQEGKNSYLQNLTLYHDLCQVKKVPESCAKVDQLVKLGSEQCFAKNLNFCLELGTFEFNRHEFRQAAKVYNFACEVGAALSCYNLGQAYWYGSEGLAKAQKAWSKACELKDEYSCAYVYALKNSGTEFQKRVKLFEMACEKVDMNSCFQAASIYAVRKDKKNSLKYLKRSVEFGLASEKLFENLKEFEFLKDDSDFKFVVNTLKTQ